MAGRYNLDSRGKPTNVSETDLKRIGEVMELVWSPQCRKAMDLGCSHTMFGAM